MDIKNLHNKFLECNSIIDIDSRSIRNGSMFFAIKGENFDGNKFANEALKKGAKIAVIDSDDVSFNYDKNIIKVNDSLKTLQELALFHRKSVKSKILAITGSNGKTTTKELIHSVLSTSYKTISTDGNFNNHLGVPLSLLRIKDDTEFSVIELGANNFGEIEILSKISEPDYGYITNFGKAHLEGFKNISGVIKGKTELYSWLIENDKTLILNYDDPEQLKFKSSNHFSFGSKLNSKHVFEKIDSKNVTVKCDGIVYKSNLYGDYNFSNICCAISIGLEFGIKPKLIQEKLKHYSSKNNRSELIKIREACNSSIEIKRASKEIGSSLEASLIIKLEDKLLDLTKDVDFSELCITSNAKVEKNTSNEINVETLKAEGQKCSVCWKVSKNKCARPHCSLNINA